MTFNGSWGYLPYAPDEDWHTSRQVANMLIRCTGGGGNLLLNIGPAPDGSVPPVARERLAPVGRWLANYGEAIYGRADRVESMSHPLGAWTRKGNTIYFICGRWPGSEIAIGGLRSKLARARLLPGGRAVRFKQEKDRLILRGLPKTNPDKILRMGVIELEFKSRPRQVLGAGCVVLGGAGL